MASERTPKRASVDCVSRLWRRWFRCRAPPLPLQVVLAPRHPSRARVVPRPPESHEGRNRSSSKEKSRLSMAEAGAEVGAAVVSRIERRGPSAQRGAVSL